MAASDQYYRNQQTLNVVFAISSVLMLGSIGWMFAQDYYRPFKAEQRAFRDVQSALSQRMAFARLPNSAEFDEAMIAVDTAKKTVEENQYIIDKIEGEIKELLPDRDKASARYQDIKARLDSRISFYDIAVDEHGPDSEIAKEHLEAIGELRDAAEIALSERNAIKNKVRELRQKKTSIQAPLTQALTRWKQVNDQFDTQVQLALEKEWGWRDWILALPIIDGFASPIKIHQYTINDIPINYNFKQVTRFDRCVTCHQGIDKKDYTKENLRALLTVSDTDYAKLEDAKLLLETRRDVLAGLPEASKVPNPNQLVLKQLSDSYLTESRIEEFCAHPRMDLFVGPNSPHPAEKFGCTSCHRGQGSATDFTLAAHSPNNYPQKKEWTKEHDWESQHYWDFPMLPSRFVESSCVKCHHDITDLITTDGKEEAPKLLKGYNLVRENGCFGCHEINGWKDGRQIGPDMRLEPTPAEQYLSPVDRIKLNSDPTQPPGDLRKVGPSLYRLVEKTSPDWTVKWMQSPRAFRPDTRMPHFYGVSNNDPEILPEEQKEFPAAEMHAITHFLFKASQDYLSEVKKAQAAGEEVRKEDERIVARLEGEARLSKEDQKKYDDAKKRLDMLKTSAELKVLVENHKPNVDNGRRVFSEKGCLSCHRHEATTTTGPKMENGQDIPAIVSEAQFGPNLSQIREKLVSKPGDMKRASIWLQNWVKNPYLHSPRTKMPVVYMSDEEIMDLSAWMLAQPATEMGEEWASINVEDPGEKAYYDLAEVYLVRMLSIDKLETLRETKTLDQRLVADLPPDEQQLVKSYQSLDDVKYYLGKKAVSRLGCYACHSIPGFDNAKPIGVGLNDWGKKDYERLAFEDSYNFVKEHFRITEKMVDENGNPLPLKNEDGELRPPYEKFFAHALEHHDRTGYLNQKLTDPRSFDYNRLRAWDDRSRMPQFRFARTIRKEGESDEDYAARKWLDEAKAREAVMTFILGLVAEEVPVTSINRPRGPRKAVVEGRKVLDTYNCSGCHQILPGTYEFELTDNTKSLFAQLYRNQINGNKFAQDYDFTRHHSWAGRNPLGGSLTKLHAINPKLTPGFEDPSKFNLELYLTEAFRFTKDQIPGAVDPSDAPDFHPEGAVKNIRSGEIVYVPADALNYPPRDHFVSPKAIEKIEATGEKFSDFTQNHYEPYGGTFANLLTKYLIKGYPELYPSEGGESNQARASVPPSLIGQGYRTQPDWLFNFLLNPHPVRKMTVLRMPRFNMSDAESRKIVDYFAAVEQLTNPKIGLQYPYEEVPQKVSLDDSYWMNKTKDYVQALKNAVVKDKDGKPVEKDGKVLSQYQERLDVLKPVWEKVAKDYEQTPVYQQYQQQLDELKAKMEKANDKLKAELNSEKARLEGLMQRYSLSAQQKRWEEQEAYVLDGFRLLGGVGSDCLTCHQVGNIMPKGGKGNAQGPSLNMSENRLRPGWTELWIANPQRLITYSSPMPAYFQQNQPGRYQDRFVGMPHDQVQALRDVLMVYSHVLDLPVARYLPYTTKAAGDEAK